MPTLTNIVKLNENLSIGVQKHKDVKSTGYKNSKIVGHGVWTARFKFPLIRPKYKTTKIKYNPHDNGASELEATRVAYEMATKEADTYHRGIDINKPLFITHLADEYLKDIEEKTEENEDADRPINMIEGGRSYWTTKKLESAIAIWKNYLDSFIKSLPVKQTKYHLKDPSPIIQDVDPRDYDLLDSHLLKINRNLSIESRLKYITEFRHFLHWCYTKRYINYVPQIKRPHRGGNQGARDRMRKEITPEMYTQIIEYTRAKYMDENLEKGRRDYAYLFHLYILILANCGIRPPTSNTEETRLRWEDVDLKKMVIKRNEKNIKYEAIILPPAKDYWNALKKFYNRHKIKTTSGDIFTHPYNQNYQGQTNRLRLTKGTPIKSFKKQWETMAKELFNQQSGTQKARMPQSERISFSSLRAWYITQRLYSDKDIRIEQLARVVGSSIGQIESRYFRLDMDKSYAHLTANAYDTTDKEPQYNDDGYYIGRSQKA